MAHLPRALPVDTRSHHGSHVRMMSSAGAELVKYAMAAFLGQARVLANVRPAGARLPIPVGRVRDVEDSPSVVRKVSWWKRLCWCSPSCLCACRVQRGMLSAHGSPGCYDWLMAERQFRLVLTGNRVRSLSDCEDLIICSNHVVYRAGVGRCWIMG